MKNPATVLMGQIITEKTALGKMDNFYVFRVTLDANKIDVRQAVEKAFGVKVVSVNTVSCAGKKRRWRGKPGSTGSYKKAYVKLAAGQKIDKLDASAA